MAPKGAAWEAAVAYWRTLPSDAGATYDKEVTLDASEIVPQVTWGTSPQDVVPVTGRTPDPAAESDPNQKAAIERSLQYMGLEPNTPIAEVKVDKVFIGSCTNGRIEDIRAAAAIARGPRVPDGVHAMVVPGPGLGKEKAEAEGSADILQEAGFDSRAQACATCLARYDDNLTTA